jgi:integrase
LLKTNKLPCISIGKSRFMATKLVTKRGATLAGKARYLIERAGRFHARIVVPQKLRPIIHKTELSRPLGPDRRLALKALAKAVAELQSHLSAAEAQLLQASGKTTRSRSLPLLTAAEAAQAHFASGLAFDSAARDADPRFALGFVDDVNVSDLRRVASGAAGTEEILGTVGRILQISEQRGSPTHSAGTAEWRSLARRLALAELASLNVTAYRDDGHQDPPLPDFADPVVYTPGSIAQSMNSIREVFEGYRKELHRSGKGKNADKRWAPVIEDLILAVGHNHARGITRHDAVRWKDRLLETLAPKTVRDFYLTTARSAFTWALDNLHVEQNPFLGVKVRLAKKILGRPKGFSDVEAIGILKSAHAYKSPSVKEHPKMAAAKRWTPFLAAYTGARIGELTQLRAEDVQSSGEICFIRITPEAGSVKSRAFRDVPLHPHLVDLRFLEYVKTIGAGPLFYQGRIAKPGMAPSDVVAGRVGKWIRSLNIADKVVQPNHGWRHRLKTVGRDIGIDPVVLDAIQGHAARTAGEAYGDVSLKAKQMAISRFPAFRID